MDSFKFPTKVVCNRPSGHCNTPYPKSLGTLMWEWGQWSELPLKARHPYRDEYQKGLRKTPLFTWFSSLTGISLSFILRDPWLQHQVTQCCLVTKTKDLGLIHVNSCFKAQNQFPAQIFGLQCPARIITYLIVTLNMFSEVQNPSLMQLGQVLPSLVPSSQRAKFQPQGNTWSYKDIHKGRETNRQCFAKASIWYLSTSLEQIGFKQAAFWLWVPTTTLVRRWHLPRYLRPFVLETWGFYTCIHL